MSAPLQNHNPILRVGLYLVAALAIALVVGCGSQSAPAPDPTVAPTLIPFAIPTATAVIPTPAPGGGDPARAMAPNFSLPSADGAEVALSGLLDDHKAVVIVFYRGFF